MHVSFMGMLLLSALEKDIFFSEGHCFKKWFILSDVMKEIKQWLNCDIFSTVDNS